MIQAKRLMECLAAGLTPTALMVSMFFLVDREGKTIGNALSGKPFTDTQLNNDLITNRLLFGVTPSYLDFSSNYGI
ncbi:MAG: hypothetical protein IPP76_13120 [Moraxellaceae bacterium]|nr:hypothetical protein [Moraxellaceae bacterium]